jgi:hypothetical protein
VSLGTLVSVNRNRIDLKLRQKPEFISPRSTHKQIPNAPVEPIQTSSPALNRLRKRDRSTQTSHRIVNSTWRAMDDLLGGERPGVDDIRLFGCDRPTTVVGVEGQRGRTGEGEVRVGIEEGGRDADGVGSG